MIEQLSVQYEVQESCRALGVSRSGYYQWKKAEQSPRAREDQVLGQKIEAIFLSHCGRYGSPRVTQVLCTQGQPVGKKRVARLMRQKQLKARRKRAFRPKTTQRGKEALPNRVRSMEIERPDSVWVSDITYVATKEGWLYLAVILDLFSRRVVGWKLGERLDAELVRTALRNALLLRQPPVGLLFHSDRGCQYSSQVVRKALEVIGANRSMSGVGNCYDNAKCEAFFSSLKTECFPESSCFETKQEAKRVIFEYIEIYYNSQRLHSALGYRTPRGYEAAYTEKRKQFSRQKNRPLNVVQKVEATKETRPQPCVSF